MVKRVLIGLYKGSIDKYINKLEQYDKEGFLVYTFDNLDEETIKSFSLDNILKNVLTEEYKDDEINFISNSKEIVLNEYKKNSFKYNSFIFDNSYSPEERIEIDEIFKYNFNLYHIDNVHFYDFTSEKLENFIQSVRYICSDDKCFFDNYFNVEKKSEAVKKALKLSNDNEKNNIENRIACAIEQGNDKEKIYYYSFMTYNFNKKEYIDNLLELSLKSSLLNKNNKFFIMYQIIRNSFINKELKRSVDFGKIKEIYSCCYDEFNQLTDGYKFISKDKRDENLIVVFVSQFLTLEHGPTKTTLDRCYSLIKNMHKKVIIINTKELITSKGITPMNNLVTGSVIKKYENMNNIKYKDIEIPFYQPSCRMPDEGEIINIFNFIRDNKPYLLLNIGGYSITADMCSRIVPMASIATSGGYGKAESKGQFFIFGRKAKEEDYIKIQNDGYDKRAIIESLFTYGFKEQENHYARKTFDLPEDRIIATIVGGRLNDEVDEDFLDLLNKLAKEGLYIVSIGGYNLSDEYKEKYTYLRDNFKDLGFQNDILAVVELVDLYINPKRQGGCTSAVECMYKRKPAFSLKYGDVAELINKEGIVSNYNELFNNVLRCMKDKEYYLEMVNRAKETADNLLNTDKYLEKAYLDIVSSPLFL